MNTMTRATLVLMALFIMGSFQPAGAAAPTEVQQAAQKGLSHFLSTIPASELANMGLMNQEEVKAATLGTPFEVFTLTPAALDAYQSGQRLAPLVSTTNTWMYPILVHGNPRTLLEVAFINGRWEPGAIGGNFLAPRLIEMQKSSTRLMETQKSSTHSLGLRKRPGGQHMRFVRIFQVQQDFMLLEAADGDYLYPVIANRLLSLSGETLYTPEQVVPQLKEKVKAAIEQWNGTKKMMKTQ